MSDASDVRSYAQSPSSNIYRAVWRWHFYAGLLVLPFLMLLAITGALYLFNDELDALVHSDLKRVEDMGTPRLAPTAILGAALASHPGTPFRYVPPADRHAAAEAGIEQPSGRVTVYVDPYDGRVLGSLPDGGTIMGFVKTLHSLSLFGTIANAAVEIAAGWAIILTVSGLYLWWPRGRGGVVSLRGRPRQRTWWRDLHAVTGAFAAIFIIFLALTGMPWSVFWGDRFGAMIASQGLGIPPGVWYGAPKSDVTLAELGAASWALERTKVPLSAGGEGRFTLDDAVSRFDAMGLSSGYTVALPATADGVFTGSAFPDEVAGERVIHLDRYSGALLMDVGYDQYGPVGKVTSWGISVHTGREFGRVNQIAMLAACLAIFVLCVSAAVMWWKRRPAGSLGTPPLPQERSWLYGVCSIIALGGILFPLTGASFLTMIVIEYIGLKWLARPRAGLS